ncbi:MAG: hypothetical protein JF611_11870 [Betaproteobacteria bacterium]|nr:hypothetical protein [Betaproteobacteria bacterium]
MSSWRCIAAALIVGLAGCAATRSYDAELVSTLNRAGTGNVDAAISNLEANNRSSDKDLLYYFELGMLERMRNRYDESQKAWLAAQKRIETNERTASDLLRSASSYVVSDRVRTYEPHDYEKVMLLTYMALNQLATGRFDDARVAIKQTHELEAQIALSRAKELAEVEAQARKRGAKTSFKELNGYPVETIDNAEVNALKNGYQSALSHYLAGFVYESLGEPSLAAPGYRLANELQPNNPALEEALRGLESRLSGADDGMTEVLFIVSAGAAPALRGQQFRLPVPVNNNFIVIPFSFPVLAPGPFADAALGITVGGAQRVPLSRITSIDLMARRSLKDDMPSIMLRATVRATTSAVLQYQAQQHSDKQAGAAAAIGAFALAAFLQGADDRTWRTLPGEVSIGRVRLPPGVHEVALQTFAGEQVARVDISGRYAVIDFRLLSGRLYVNAPQGRS